jgi:hypothetical protein
LNPEQIGLWAGFVLTIMIFSYVLGDNFLYRIAVYVFVGLAAGYITIVTVESVILPWLSGTLGAENAGVGNMLFGLIPLVIGVLLFLKTSPRLGRLGNLGIAFIIGVGTSVALVGAVPGTLLPLAAATSSSVSINVLNGFLIFIGVASTLLYFQYLARRSPGGVVQRGAFTRVVGTVGQGFVVVALAALYAGAILTSLTIFSERIGFIVGRISGG